MTMTMTRTTMILMMRKKTLWKSIGSMTDVVVAGAAVDNVVLFRDGIALHPPSFWGVEVGGKRQVQFRFLFFLST